MTELTDRLPAEKLAKTLRDWAGDSMGMEPGDRVILGEAAAEIDRLTGEVSRLEEAGLGAIKALNSGRISMRESSIELLAGQAEIATLRDALAWQDIEDGWPPPHTHVWCFNRDGRQFEGCPCYGMHKPFMTYPRGDGNASNTHPSWIDVTHWKPLDKPDKGQGDAGC